jgi:hypothetical protein
MVASLTDREDVICGIVAPQTEGVLIIRSESESL